MLLNRVSFRTWVIAASIGLYVLSLLLPGLTVHMHNGRQSHWLGLALLAFGWLGALKGAWAWYANPLWFAALFCVMKRSDLSMPFAAAALLLAFASMPGLQGWTIFFPSEAMRSDEVGPASLELGYWLWIASFAVLLVETPYRISRDG